MQSEMSLSVQDAIVAFHNDRIRSEITFLPCEARDEDKASVVHYCYRDMRFCTVINPRNFFQSPGTKHAYLGLFRTRAQLDADPRCADGLARWALEPLLDVLRRVPEPSQQQVRTVEDYAVPRLHTHQLSAVFEEPRIVALPVMQNRPRRGLGVRWTDRFCATWPMYHASELQFSDAITHRHPPDEATRVRLHDSGPEYRCQFVPCSAYTHLDEALRYEQGIKFDREHYLATVYGGLFGLVYKDGMILALLFHIPDESEPDIGSQ